ncbi:MAG: Na+/H+ antiporter NhaC [Flavobacteriales bacterium]|nr:Na+/H+ antiporter NhaC [Flavobacteriales bacterium]
MSDTKSISLFFSFLPIIVLIPFLGLNVYFFGDNTLSGPNQLALLFSAAVGIAVGIQHKFSLQVIFKSIEKNIASTVEAMIILLLIGSLAGSWMLGGIVPAFMDYGLKILHPSYFLVASTVICAVISLASGSSWSTIATIGIALLSIGKALGFSEGIIAGAIISGAYFGDKMSPLSDTTNLAAAMARTDLFKHIKYMLITTGPSFSINILIFAGIGLFYDTPQTQVNTELLSSAIENTFYISPVLFLVPAVVIFLIIKKIKPTAVLFIGAILGVVCAVIFQPELVAQIGGNSGNYFQDVYRATMISMGSEMQITTSNEGINDLLATGGMAGMMPTIWLILCAMTFGGVMDAIGALTRITAWLMKGVSTATGVVATTAGSSLFINFTASDQYLAIVIPGKMYGESFEKMGLAPENLSRTLEDSGTVTSVLIPWNTCGATQSAVLGVGTFVYLPYCFFNYISPVMTILFAWLNIKIAHTQKTIEI